jgi:hypothetical protein
MANKRKNKLLVRRTTKRCGVCYHQPTYPNGCYCCTFQGRRMIIKLKKMASIPAPIRGRKRALRKSKSPFDKLFV